MEQSLSPVLFQKHLMQKVVAILQKCSHEIISETVGVKKTIESSRCDETFCYTCSSNVTYNVSMFVKIIMSQMRVFDI